MVFKHVLLQTTGHWEPKATKQVKGSLFWYKLGSKPWNLPSCSLQGSGGPGVVLLGAFALGIHNLKRKGFTRDWQGQSSWGPRLGAE